MGPGDPDADRMAMRVVDVVLTTGWIVAAGFSGGGIGLLLVVGWVVFVAYRLATIVRERVGQSESSEDDRWFSTWAASRHWRE